MLVNVSKRSPRWLKSVQHRKEFVLADDRPSLLSMFSYMTGRKYLNCDIIARTSTGQVWDTVTMCKNRVFDLYLWLMSCKKQNTVCNVVSNCLLARSLIRNSGSKQQNNPAVSAYTIRHCSTYIILSLTLTLTPILIHPLTLTHSVCLSIYLSMKQLT